MGDRRPLRRAAQQPRWRHESRTDLCYWLFAPLLTRVVRRVAFGIALLVLALVTGRQMAVGDGVAPLIEGSWVTAQPWWIEVPLLIVVADLIGYWTHRLFHRRRLWRLHAIHHSSAQLDWLASVRVHPVNDALGGVLRAVPLLLLGFDPLVVGGLMPVLALHGLLLHANVPWSFGPLRHVISSPRFHRWHHARLDALPPEKRRAGGVNFAGLFPIFDLLFGTYYAPVDEQPRVFGVGDPVPFGLWAQLGWPFRRNRSTTVRAGVDQAVADDLRG